MKHSFSLDGQQILPYIRDGTVPIIVAFSGGKDSVAMVLYLLEHGVDRHRIHLHHHDVDGGGPNLFDWPCTKSYCKAFADAMGLSLYFSYREGGIYREIFRNVEPHQDILYQREPGGQYFRIPSDKNATITRLKFPAVSSNLLARWCSSTLKIDHLASIMVHHPLHQDVLGCSRIGDPSRVLQWRHQWRGSFGSPLGNLCLPIPVLVCGAKSQEILSNNCECGYS